MQKIGFVGLGNMGCPMAANLTNAGFGVLGFDLSTQAQAAAAAAGVELASSLENAVTEADAVVTMLPGGQHVTSVWLEIGSMVAPGTLLIDSSTISVGSAREAHAIAAGLNCPSLDAPVSGGTGGAKAATLTFMAGGSRSAFDRAFPILKKMGASIFHCGDAGAGQAAKICNNMLLGISMIGVSEALVLAEKLGLSHQALFDVASVSSGQCWSLTSYCPVPKLVPTSPANNDYKPGFAATLMLKDLRLAQEAASSTGASTPLGAEAAQIYSLFHSLGRGGEDFSGIIHLLRGQIAERQS